MTFIGVLQTDDVVEAIKVAETYVKGGKHVICERVDFSMSPEQERAFMEEYPDMYLLTVNEHFTVEYQVSVDFPERE